MTRREEEIKKMVDVALANWDFNPVHDDNDLCLLIGLKRQNYEYLASSMAEHMRYDGCDKWSALERAARGLGKLLLGKD